MVEIDHHDRNILRVLQTDGKIGNQELAEKVNLSNSPCWRRVKKLEEAKVIDGYVAMLNPKRLDLSAMAYVHIALLDHTQQTIEMLDDFVALQEQIVECSSITGPNDYVLKIIEKDTESLLCKSYCDWALSVHQRQTLFYARKNTPRHCLSKPSRPFIWNTLKHGVARFLR